MSGNQKQQQTDHQNQATVKAGKIQQKTVTSINPEQMLSAPETLRSEDVLAAQQQVGNQVVQRALEKKGRDHRVTDNQGNLNEDLTRQIQAKRGGGSPLPDSIQKDASSKLGRKFNDVRIHTDDTADKLSRSVSARAFTIGKDIFFKGGVFSPASSAGRETLIHELTHVVQQSSGKASSGGKLKLGAPDTAMEKEAAHMGKKHTTQQGAAQPAAGAVQRQEEEEELQMQEDEEELQMQPDAGVAIQRVEEEELLQGQPDAIAAIQRQGEEEELQMQEDEEEIQMQPDASSGGVIQRDLKSELDDEFKKRRAKAGSRKKFNQGKQDAVKKIDEDVRKKVFSSHEQEKKDAIPAPPTKAPALPKAAGPVLSPGEKLKAQISENKVKTLQEKKKKDDFQSSVAKGQVGELKGAAKMTDEERSAKLKASLDPKGAEKESKAKAKADAKKSKDDAKKAKEDEKKLNKRVALAAKDPKKFNEMQAKEKADAEKAKAKEEAKAAKAKGGEAKPVAAEKSAAVSKPETEKSGSAAKPEEGKKEAEKKPGFLRKGLGLMGKGIKHVAGKKFGEFRAQYGKLVGLEKKEDEEKKDEAKSAGVTINNYAGGGGAPGGGPAGGGEAIAALKTKVETLEQKVESLMSKKKEEVVPEK